MKAASGRKSLLGTRRGDPNASVGIKTSLRLSFQQPIVAEPAQLIRLYAAEPLELLHFHTLRQLAFRQNDRPKASDVIPFVPDALREVHATSRFRYNLRVVVPPSALFWRFDFHGE
jgi:hypothetical protein